MEEAARLARLAYQAVGRMPREHRRTIWDQLRRAALSVHANLVEGSARPTGADRQRLLGLAWGSLRELEAHARLAIELGLLKPAPADELLRSATHTGRLLTAFRRAAPPY